MGGFPKTGQLEVGSPPGAAQDTTWTHTWDNLWRLQAAPFGFTKGRMFLLIDYPKSWPGVETGKECGIEVAAVFFFSPPWTSECFTSLIVLGT